MVDSTTSAVSLTVAVGEEAPATKELVDDGSKRRTSVMPRAPLLLRDDSRSVSLASLETTGGESGLATLRLDGCGLRGASLESLGTSPLRRFSFSFACLLIHSLHLFTAQGVRNSTVKNVSLRRNKISSLGGVALAIMIKDIPDQPSTSSSNPFSQPPPTTTTTSSTTPTPPPPTTTYSAYTPRRRQTASSVMFTSLSGPIRGEDGSEEAALKPIPLFTTNQAGGVTKRTLPVGYSLETPDGSDDEDDGGASAKSELLLQREKGTQSSLAGASMMQSRVRSLDDVTRLGRLVTLDLKGNDLRVSSSLA